MRKTKVKFLIMLAISMFMLIIAGGKVFGAEDYTIKYEEEPDYKCKATISFKNDIQASDLERSPWFVVDDKTVTQSLQQLEWNTKEFLMADGTTLKVEYHVPAFLYINGPKIKPDFVNASHYTIGNEEIVKFDENNYLYGIKPGKTTISTTINDEEKVWDIEVKALEADDWTDTTNWTYELKSENRNLHNTLNFSNVNFKENHRYTLLINNSDSGFFDESGVVYETVDTSGDNCVYFAETGKSGSIDKWLEKSGDVYFQIVESYLPEGSNKYASKVIYKKTKIERPTYKLGTKTYSYFFDEYTSTYVYVPNAASDRKMNVKIGKVSDINILRSIKNQENGCMEKLLDYAKKEEGMYNGTLNIGRNESITSGLNLVNREYYFVYTVLDDENGKYYPIEDIGLYQAVVADSVGKNLFSSIDSQFVWNLPEATEPSEEGQNAPAEDNTVKPSEDENKGKTDGTESPNLGPQAGKGIMALVVVAVVSGIVFISYRKYRNIRI